MPLNMEFLSYSWKMRQVARNNTERQRQGFNGFSFYHRTVIRTQRRYIGIVTKGILAAGGCEMGNTFTTNTIEAENCTIRTKLGGNV